MVRLLAELLSRKAEPTTWELAPIQIAAIRWMGETHRGMALVDKPFHVLTGNTQPQ